MMAYGMTKYFQLLRSLKIRECFIVVCFVLVKPVGKFAYCSCSSVAGDKIPCEWRTGNIKIKQRISVHNGVTKTASCLSKMILGYRETVGTDSTIAKFNCKVSRTNDLMKSQSTFKRQSQQLKSTVYVPTSGYLLNENQIAHVLSELEFNVIE